MCAYICYAYDVSIVAKTSNKIKLLCDNFGVKVITEDSYFVL